MCTERKATGEYVLSCFLSATMRHRLAYQVLENVKINKYAKFELNIPCGSRVMDVLTNGPP